MSKKILYVLDPGHYTGYNKGIVPGYYEGNKMQALAAAQKKYLEQYGITAILTKNTAKENPGLLDRGKVAVNNAKGYDIVIFESLHTNSPGPNVDKEKVYGALAIRSKFLPESEGFITAVLNSVVDTMKKGTGVTYSRGVSTKIADAGYDWYGVLQGAMQRAKSESEALEGPVDYAFILEHGFHSNIAECTWLNDNNNLDLLAKNKAAKIAEWFGLASTDKEDEDQETSIMGTATCTAEQMETYLLSVNPNAGMYATDIPKLFLEEGAIEGVRGDVAFAQSCHETGNFKFTGDVVPEQNNFAGIGTTGGGVKGAYFENARIGVRAQIQHLKAYASKTALKQECVDPRFNLVTRGVAPMVEDLGGRWAYPGYPKDKYNSLEEAKKAKASYGDKIISVLNAIEAIEIIKEVEEETTQVVTDLYKVGSAWENGACKDQVGAYRILDNAIKQAKDTKNKVFLNGVQVYPEVENKPVAETEYYRVAKSYINNKYVGQIGAYSVLTNAIKNCKTGYQVFNPKGESLYPTFKDMVLTHSPGIVQIIKDGDNGEGIELHYTPEFNDQNLDKVHGPAHLGHVYDVIGIVEYEDNKLYLLSNGSYITTCDIYVKFIEKSAKLTYTAGKYKTTADCSIRKGPGSRYDIIAYNDMTEDAKKGISDKKIGGYYPKGTTFFALEVINTDKTSWGRTPSGWICIEGTSNNKQVKYCTPV